MERHFPIRSERMPIEITQPEKIQNLDILDLTYRIDRWLNEMQKSVSATRNESTKADRDRWNALLGDFGRKFILSKAEPEMDLPKYHPISRPLPPVPVLEDKQNVDVMRCTHLLIACRTEILESGDAERVSGFSEAGAGRIDAVIKRLTATMKEIDENPEVDSPNSPDEKPGVTTK